MNEHQKVKALRRWNEGYNTAQIARALKVHEGKVEIFLSQERSKMLKEGRPVDNVRGKVGTRPRKCLNCRDDFESEHSGQRVCDTCKRQDVWTSGDMG